MRARTVAVLCATVLLPARTQAQQVWGSISGRVVEDTAPVAAQVQVSSKDLLGARTVLADRAGYYVIHALPPGTYTVRVIRIGRRPVTIDSVTVQLGRTTPLGTARLESSATRLDEIRITARHLSIDPTSTVHGATLTPEDFAVLPAARDYRLLMEILPDIVQSGRGDPLNANGATGLESAYFIDGMNVSDQTNGFWPTTLPYNVIKAVEVKTGGYEAQYGKALGAVVSATTYSGSNAFAMNIFAFNSNAALSAKPRQQPTLRESNDLRYDVGVRVSGPIRRDRLWYSAAYNPRIWGSDREITTLGSYRDHHLMNVFATKLSLRANDATNFELSLFGDPAIHHLVEPTWGDHAPLNADPYRMRFDAGNTVGVLRGTVQRSRLLFEASVARSAGKSSFFGDTEAARNDVLFADDSARTISGGVGFWSRSDLARSSFTAKGTLTWRGHTTVAGVEYEDVSVFRDFSWTGGYLLLKLPGGGFLTHTDSVTGTFHNRVPTAYLQNNWRATDELTISTGLRWSSQTLTSASGRTAQQFRNEWQPRVGVVWQPSGSRNDRLYASFGRFYLELPLNMATLWYVDYASKDSYYASDPRQPGSVPYRVDDFGGRESDAPKSIQNLAVENADELSVGYDRLVGSSLKLSVRALRRDLRSSFQWGFDSTWKAHIGTPGRGDFTFLPKPVRRYRAFEVAAEGRWREVSYRASYVLSRNRGNFTGLFNSDDGYGNPGAPGNFVAQGQAMNSTGLLPNDHTHVFKLSGSRRMNFGLTTGTFLTAQSGSPMNAMGSTLNGVPIFVVPRGSAGHTPWTWSANVRLLKDLRTTGRAKSRVMLDVFDIGNPQRPYRLVEQKYLYQSGTPTPVLNSTYGRPLTYQQPMQIRLGVEVEF